MGTSPGYPRRALLKFSVILAVTGCAEFKSITTKPVAASEPQEAIKDYFALLSASRYDEARTLISPAYQTRLGDSGLDTMLRAVKTAKVSDMVDAVSWANDLGARLPTPPSDRREYLVTLAVDPNTSGSTDWTEGINRRFIDLVEQGARWQIDNIDIVPGVLVTGQPPREAPTQRQMVVVPTSSLRLGPAPVDRAIFTARQNAVDRGLILWATDPVAVARHDGPSFGWNAADPAFLLGESENPKTLGSQVLVQVKHQDQRIVVTLEQPIRTGPGGVWAITAVKLAGAVTK